MKFKKKYVFIPLTVMGGLLILLPLVAIGIVKWYVLPPDKLTPLVLNRVNPMIEGQVECERIELTFWETFPKVGLRLTNGEIVTGAQLNDRSLADNLPYSSDTLLRFSRAMVSVDVMDYIHKDRITIERLYLENPYFYGSIDVNGRANWDIVIDEEQEEYTGDTTEIKIPVIDLQRVRVSNGHFIYEDRTADLYAEIDGFDLRMRNHLTKGNLRTDVQTGFESLVFDHPAYTLENNLSLNFKSKIDFSRGRIAFSEAELTLNNLPFTTDGEIHRQGENLALDVVFGMKAENLADLLAFVPDEYFQNRKKITARGAVSLEGKINGLLGDSVAPDILLSCLIGDGYLKSKGSSHGIEKLDSDVDLYLNGNSPDSSYVVFRKIELEGTNTSFVASGRIARPTTDPYVDTRVKGRIDFAGMMQDILNPDSIVLRGMVEADLEAAFRVEEILDGDFSRLHAAGKLDIERMMVADRAAGLSLFMKGVRFSADTTRQVSSYLTNDDLISAFLRVDTLNIRYRGEINTRVYGLDLQAKTSRTIDTTSVVSLTTRINMESIMARLPDSVWVAARNITVQGGLKPSATEKKKGVFAGQVSMDTLRYFDIPTRTRLTMDNGTFNLEAMPLRDAVRQRGSGTVRSRQRRSEGTIPNPPMSGNDRMSRSDSVALREGGAPVSVASSETLRDPNPVTPGRETGRGPSGGILRHWEIRGSVKFDGMRLFTGAFPLPMRMGASSLRFDTDKISLNRARLQMGKSDFLLDGEISSIRRALLVGGTLRGKLTIASDYIDCNQLMRAINRSSLFADHTSVPAEDEERWVETWSGETEEESVDLPQEDGLFVIPANLDLVLKTTARKVDFEDVELENIDGEIVVRNQSLNLRKLSMDSNIGSGNLTMVYAAKDRQKATAGFELEMNDIIVERLLGMFPAIDTLLPMLRSFEGVLDCQMTATCDLDSTMSVVFPSLHSACYLNGENMVLMDGETFSEISKTLMFKNKERNLIDYISVDLLIRDNKIEVFPFMVELDRYKLAVGGTHHLDLTYDYHVSVLKSPVPFKLGLDITGDMDDFTFRIVKCRYKNLFKAARESELAQARLNLRSSIRESIRRQLAANAPELAAGYTDERVRTRRPEPFAPDMDPDEDIGEASAPEKQPEETEEIEGQTLTETDTSEPEGPAGSENT